MRLRYVFLILVVAVCAVLLAYGHFQQQLNAPGPLAAEKIIYIEPGSGTKKIAADLFDAGAIEDADTFSLGAKLEGGKLKAGEYEIPAGASALAVIRLLQTGKPHVRHLTIPEGLTSAEITALVNKAEAMEGSIGETPPEGSLLPETYNYSHGDGRIAMITRMQKAMESAVNALWAKRNPALPLKSKEEAVALASIVERETGVSSERPRVAGVFYNRLKDHMPLQSDPTVIYAITLGKEKLGRALSRADLETASPYNTYLNQGLPPGPIANPGRAALEAVMNPEENHYLYFVADGTGGHAFAKSLDEHARNVAKWRELERGHSK